MGYKVQRKSSRHKHMATLNFSSLIYLLLFFSSCQRIETGNSLSASDLNYIQSLHLLDSNERLYKFYSEHTKKAAGNFFTNKRMAKYWIDEKDSSKNETSCAFYSEIKSIDTVYHAGFTYCPYMLVTKKNGDKFKVCVEGKRNEIKAFFEEALQLWQNSRSGN
jgi:hypothetical protein